MNDLELHPLCSYFPRMSDSEFNALKSDINVNGQLHPIFILDGMILDGGNRYRALTDLGITPICEEYTGNNPVQFVLSSNLHRRHLTQGQAAAIVSATQDWAKAHPAHRVAKEAGTSAALSKNQTAQVPLDTVADRAAESGTGERTQRKADKLVKNATSELVKQVTTGEKSLNQALKEIDPPKVINDFEIPEDEPENEPDFNEIIEDLQAQIKEVSDENKVLKNIIESNEEKAAILSLTTRLNTAQTNLNKALRKIDWMKKRLIPLPENERVIASNEVDCWE